MAALASGCTKAEASDAEAGAAGEDPGGHRRRRRTPGLRYSASIEAFEQVPLAFKATGYVDDLLRRSGADGRLRAAQPGDRVTHGTVLARVRETDYARARQAGPRAARRVRGVADQGPARSRTRQALFAADSVTKPELDAAQAAFDGADARRDGGDGRPRARRERACATARSSRRRAASSSSAASRSAPWPRRHGRLRDRRPAHRSRRASAFPTHDSVDHAR